MAYLHQRGSRLTGWVAVWGLPPKTAHAALVHGPNADCRPATRRTKNHVAELPVLRADAKGVAFARLNVRVHTVAVARGRT